MEGESSEADVLRVVEQAMRIRMVWEEVCFTHRGCPFGEVKEALVETAGRWGVPIDDAFAVKAALEIHSGSWE